MKIPSILSNNPVLVGGVLIVGVAALWLSLRGAKGMGKDIGGGAVDMVFGTVAGVTGAVGENLNDPSVNPLHGVGTWVGGTVYDFFN